MESIMSVIPAGTSVSRLGTVVTVDGVRMVNVGGNNLLASWADPIVVDDGDSVNVQIYAAGVGQGRTLVTGRSTTQPRPRTATVTQVPAGSPTITVTANGVAYVAEPVGGPYVVGELVHLDWGAGSPRVIGKVAVQPPPTDPVGPASPVQPPPPRPTAARITATARTSRTWTNAYGWGTHAGDGNRVHQGVWGGVATSGAFFYGTPFKPFAGRTISRIEFRTGQRLAVGASNAPAVFHFYAHTNPSQPGGDTNRVVGPFNVTIQPGQSPRWIDLPLSFAQILINGGGIAIFGDPYAGMQGVTSSSPDSGTIRMHAA